jgi:hypothetical protein
MPLKKGLCSISDANSFISVPKPRNCNNAQLGFCDLHHCWFARFWYFAYAICMLFSDMLGKVQ